MAWSYSALKKFETCNRQYHETTVLKNYPFVQNEQALYGDAVHKAAEKYVTDKTPFPEQFAFMQPIVDALLSKPGAKIAERNMALNAKLEPCRWMAKDVWVRGKADLLILDEATAWVVDYKTGSDKYVDKDQLDLMSVMVMEHYPEINKVHSALAFVVKNNFITHKRFRKDKDALWWEYRNRVAKIDAAHASGVWNPTQSGLCRKYCEVLSCEFNGRG